MNLTRKVKIAETAILSISRHDDETIDNVFAALDAVAARIVAEKAAFEYRHPRAPTTTDKDAG